MSNQDKNKINNKSLATYLPYSEHCLAPKFLPNQGALNTFIRLIQEANTGNRTSITQVLAEMPGLTAEQKKQAIQAAKQLETQPSRKKLECQF